MLFQFPLIDLTELGILLAIGEIVLLISAQISGASYGLAESQIDKKRLDNAAIIAGILFLVTISLRIYFAIFK